MALGEVSTAYFKNPITGGMMEFTYEVIVYEEGHAFGWSGDAMLGRQDHHIFRIEELSDGRAKFKQEDGLNGKKSNFLIRMVEALFFLCAVRRYVGLHPRLVEKSNDVQRDGTNDAPGRFPSVAARGFGPAWLGAPRGTRANDDRPLRNQWCPDRLSHVPVTWAAHDKPQ